MTNPESFSHNIHWIKRIRQLAPENVILSLIGNKCDLTDDEMVSEEQIEELCEKKDVKYFATSAKTGENINEAFDYMAGQVYQTFYEKETNIPKRNTFVITEEEEQK